MVSGHKPTASEVLDVMDRLQRDRDHRGDLTRSEAIFRACVAEELLDLDAIDWLAQALQELHGEGLVAYGSVHGGVLEPCVWDGSWIGAVSNWRVTSAGRADAALFRRESGKVSFAEIAFQDQDHDLFISHAGEDKDLVARPLAVELAARGWKVWLDEVQLTLGDSLSSGIDEALVRSRFGVVVLSRAFFGKPWPRRELEGLTAREVAAGSKVILPVWHDVDERYLVQQSPVLADKVGVRTSIGLAAVADKISEALERAGLRGAAGLAPEPVLQSAEPSARLPIPTTSDEQARLMIERPDYWEYRLLAGVLVADKRELEGKWDDHELHVPRGPRREFAGPEVSDYLSRELGWLIDRLKLVNRIFDEPAWAQAMGARGEPGDPAKIENLARRITKLYEDILDWAAALRNTSVSDSCKEAREATACIADAPLASIREFVDDMAQQIEHIAETAARARDEGATEEAPLTITLPLTIRADTAALERYRDASVKLSEQFTLQD